MKMLAVFFFKYDYPRFYQILAVRRLFFLRENSFLAGLLVIFCFCMTGLTRMPQAKAERKEIGMKSKYTACLASLLMACPLAAPTVSAATDWDENYVTGTSGVVESSNHKVTGLPDTEYSNVYIGHAENTGSGEAKACNNTFTYTGSLSSPNNWQVVYGGYAEASAGTATASGNTVILDDVNNPLIGFSIYGGCADGTTAIANNNTVIFKGGTYDGDIISIYGGRATSETRDNSVEFHVGADGKSPDFTCVPNLMSFIGGTGTISTGNSLKFFDVKGMTALTIEGFQKLNFEYSEMHAGDVILTLYQYVLDSHYLCTTSIANAEVSVNVKNLYGEDGGEFKLGDKVYLLKCTNGVLDTEGIKTKATITAETGISLTYEVEIQANDTELYLIRTGTIDRGDTDDTTVQPGTKAIAEGAASGLALAAESANATMGLLQELTIANGTITPFVYTKASSMRHETGSSLNVSTVSLVAGLGTGIETGAGNLSLGAFFEYGKGSYTTHNSFDSRSDIDGDGNSWYMGGGILAKMDFVETGPGHFYLEGSAHMGTLHNEYDSNDLYDANGNVAKFDMDSPYYSLHGGLGYVWNMAEGHDLDIYGKYIWTRVQGTDDTLTTKDKFEYDDMDSNRVRFGVRYTYKGSDRFSPYVGAAFEHEFSGSCESTAYGHPVAAPSFEGSSGMGELGLMMKPTEDLPLSINLGVQGYVGQKQGISGSCNLMYEF